MPRGGNHCDFCGDALVARLYACRNFDWDGHAVFTHPVGRWAACVTCSDLIDGRAWLRLTNRVMNQVARRANLTIRELPDLRKDLRLLYSTLAVHLVAGEVLRVLETGRGLIGA